MAKAEVFSGICGYSTTIHAVMNGHQSVVLEIESECEAVQELGEALKEVDPFQEITFRGEGPLTLRMAHQFLCHTACPVPAGIIKAVEVAAGLALPADATITVSKDGSGT